MKISSRQFLKAFLVGAGLFAVLVAYRANSKSPSSNDLFYVGAGDIKLRMPASETANGPDVAAQEMANHLPEPAFVDRNIAEPNVVEPSVVGSNTIGLNVIEPMAEMASLPVDSVSKVEADADANADSEFVGLVMDNESGADPETELMLIAESSETIVAEESEQLDGIEEAQIPAEINSGQSASAVTFLDAATESSAPSQANIPVALNDSAALKAVHHIEYGKSLARRSATEAAGQEFFNALRILAESNDTSAGGNAYMNALRSGLQAVKEAGDFKVGDPQQQISMNVASIIEGHETKIVSDSEARTMTASNATRRYLEYAGMQFGICGGQNPVAAEALYCIGKMRTISAQSNPDPESSELYEAIIFQHAALTADPTNHRSANELGVLLARSGQLVAAETYLKNSLQLKPTPHGWANLARVHQRKGTPADQQLANLAMNEFQKSVYQQQTPAVGASPIQMVSPQEFVARSPAQHPDTHSAPTGVNTNVVPAGNFSEESPSFVQRIGSLFSPTKSNR